MCGKSEAEDEGSEVTIWNRGGTEKNRTFSHRDISFECGSHQNHIYHSNFQSINLPEEESLQYFRLKRYDHLRTEQKEDNKIFPEYSWISSVLSNRSIFNLSCTSMSYMNICISPHSVFYVWKTEAGDEVK
ncbi:hypothetical protein CEXT_421011 [Caerostris extrusa]|uniref:Uncharacterized protein n=1 Tax=Caerostris extrusa TaxID=172846 RepID=A0AAV4RZK5_CAEEX|nr:hypothetical protein CEXT_421011 [Caerostris extrusa]